MSMTELGQTLDKTFTQALVDVHGSYRSTRLSHEPPDELISDEVTWRVLRPHLVRSAGFFAVYLALGFFAVMCWLTSIFIGLVWQSSDPFGPSRDPAGATFFGGIAILLQLLMLAVMVLWVVGLFRSVSEPIAEYGLLIEGRASAAPAAYWWIMQTMRRRQTPFRVQLARVASTPIMTVSHGRVRGLIVVQAFGSDLYMGWTMWRARSTMVVLGHLLRDIFRGAGVGSFTGDVRNAANRALRELIHSATREGVQAAVLQPPVNDETARAEIDQLPDVAVSSLGAEVPSPRQMQD